MSPRTLRQILLLLFVVAVVSSQSGQLSERKDKQKAKSLFVLLSDLWNWVSWLIERIFTLVYFVTNTLLGTVAQIMYNIVAIPQELINLVEFVGYCVRFALQANYNFVSSCATMLRHFLESCYVFLRDLVISTFETIISLFKMILQFLHKVVFSVPKLYQFAGTGIQSSAKLVGALSHNTNSSFRGVFASMQAVLELFGRSIMTTLTLLRDLISHVFISCARLFQFIGRNIISIAVSAFRGIVMVCQKITTGVQSFGWFISKSAVSLYEGTKTFLQAVFSTIYNGLLSMFQSIGLFVIHIVVCLYGGLKNTIIATSSIFNNALTNIANMTSIMIQTLKANKLTYMYGSLSLVVAILMIFIVQKINVVIMGFVLLETAIQRILMKIMTITRREPTQVQQRFSLTHDKDSAKDCSNASSSHGDVTNLKQQLQREKDKNLCVVCQDQLKKILLLPCRHMCICVLCANQLTSSIQRNRRVCPLCRTHIGSTVEVYS